MEHFRLIKHDASGRVRLGEITTVHGQIPTPCFMPVGSQGTVKMLTPADLKELGIKMILANSYHLCLRPGIEIIKELGGLHRFMGWEGPVLTDSGGYQIFSLAQLRKVTDDGVIFRSHIDGSQHLFTPELAIKYQIELGSDIMMVLDECPAHNAPREIIERAMYRTHMWARKCYETFQTDNQSLYGIIQGGLYPELREKSAKFLNSLDFAGYGIGGLSLGETRRQMYDTVEFTTSLLPPDKPRYLMGVGSPEDIIESIARGVDLFDCVLPTRIARHGALFSREGRINIRNARFKKQEEPPVPACECYTCRHFSAAYLHHLFNAGELLAFRLATIHNLFFMENLMTEIRKSIAEEHFPEFATEFLLSYSSTNEEKRLSQKHKWLAKYGDQSW